MVVELSAFFSPPAPWHPQPMNAPRGLSGPAGSPWRGGGSDNMRSCDKEDDGARGCSECGELRGRDADLERGYCPRYGVMVYVPVDENEDDDENGEE